MRTFATSMNPDEPVPLIELPSNRWAVVAELMPPVRVEDQHLVLRLMELGFVPGERVRIVAEAKPGRDPLAVRVGHTTFALRRYEAAFIRVTPWHRS